MTGNAAPQTASEFFQAELIAQIYSPGEILLNLAIAFVLAMMVAFTYRATHRGLSYSQSFLLTLIFVTIITAMVIMVIGNNLARAFALVGAMSIIRFRTVVKDTKDTAFVFFALATGLAAGTSSYFLAVAGVVFICAMAFVLHRVNFGSLYKSEFILRLRVVRDEGYDYNAVIAEFASSSNLIHVQPSGDRLTNNLTMDIVMKKDVDPSELLSRLEALEGVSDIALIASARDADY